MAYIPVANVAQVEIRGSLWGQKVENVLYFSHVGGAISGADLQTLADLIETWWTDEAPSRLARAYQYREVFATDLTTAASATATAAVNSGWFGDYGLDAATMPGNVTITVSFRTGGRGRSERGRNYWPGVPRGTVTGNDIGSGYLATIQALYEMVLPSGSHAPGGWQWVVVSRYTNGAARPAGTLTPVTTVLFADTHVDSMRRRLTSRGD